MIGFMNLCGGDGLSSVNGCHKDDFLANIVVQSLDCNVRIKLFNTYYISHTGSVMYRVSLV